MSVVIQNNKPVVTITSGNPQTIIATLAVGSEAVKLATAADRVQTGLDRIQTGIDASNTSANATQTALDVLQTNADKTQTGLDVIAADEAAAIVEPIADIADDIVIVASMYDDIHALASNPGDVTAVVAIGTEIATVSGISTEVVTVAGIATDIPLVAAIDADVTKVADIDSDVTAVAGVQGNVITVAGISGNVTTVAGIASNVTTVANNNTNINTVAGISSNVTTVAGISSNVTTVANDGTHIGIVAGISNDVQTVSGINANVTAVANDLANINTVANNTTNINIVAGISANVTTVTSISSAVTSVSNNNANVSTVAANITEVKNCSGNMASIIAAQSSANAAANSASSASTFANNASNSANAAANSANTAASTIDNTAYDATTWDNDTTHAPSKNAMRDKIESANTAYTTLFEGKKDKHGWANHPPETGKLAIAKPSTNWIFTLTADTGGTFEYYCNGVEVIVTGNKTYDLGANPTANTALHCFYFDDNTGTIKHNETGFNLYLHVPISTAFFNGTSWAITEERHYAIRDRSWHIWAHTTIGARIVASDFAMTAPAVGLNNTVNIAGGTLYDEDLIHTLSTSTSNRLWYKTASGTWTFVDPATTSYDTSVKYTDAGYNQVAVSAAKYINQWYYATPDINKTIYTIREVVASDYSSIALARAVSPPDLGLLNFKGNAECKLLYRVIWKGDETVAEVTDYRASSPVAGGGAGAVSAAAVAYTPSLQLTNVTVQGALDQLVSGFINQIDGGSSNSTYY